MDLPEPKVPLTAAGDEVVLGFAGRLIHGKGVDVLLDASVRLGASVPYRLEIAGDGPLREELEGRLVALGLQGRVRFRGWTLNVRDFWATCHVAIVPSYQLTESFGMVAIEAMAAGVPVIAARNGGLTEVVVEGQTGSLFEPGDAEMLARLIARYVEDGELRLRLGRNARERARSVFNIERCATEFEYLIASLHEEPAGAAMVSDS